MGKACEMTSPTCASCRERAPDPSSEQGESFIKNLVWLAEQERRRIRRQTGHALAALKDEGKRHCRHAPRGFKWQRRGKKKFAMVPDLSEQAASASGWPSCDLEVTPSTRSDNSSLMR